MRSPEVSGEIGSLSLFQNVLGRIVERPFAELSVLDLCCGECSHVRGLRFNESLHVDVQDWPNRPKELDFLRWNVNEIEHTRAARRERWDVTLCSDGIEHLDRMDGLRLMHRMMQYGRVAVIFTPFGEYPELCDPRLKPMAFSTDPDQHKSKWLPEQFRDLKWQTLEFPNWHGSFGAFFAWKNNP